MKFLKRILGALLGLRCPWSVEYEMHYAHLCTRPRFHPGKHYHAPSGATWTEENVLATRWL